MKIKEKVLGLKDFIKNVFQKYPLTMIILFAYTVFFAIVLDEDIISDEWLEKISLFGSIWIVGVFFVENCSKFNKVFKGIGDVVTAIISGFFVHFIINGSHELDLIEKICACYITTLSSMAIYFIIKRSGKSISEYLLKVAINIDKSTIIYGVLALGLLCIYEIFNFLILDSNGDFLGKLQILLLGFYYFPKLIYALDDLNGEVNSFFKGLVKWVLMGLVITAFSIIYIYIGKIIVLKNMPKNQIFRILAVLFVISAPVWTCMQYFKDDSFIYKVSLKLPYAFIPFIVLQIYTIGVRISSNGVTPLRYMAVCLIVLEVIYELFYIIKKERLSDLIIIFDVIVIFSLLMPTINMFDLSNLSQAKILKRYNYNDDLSDEEKGKIYGAYLYLSDTDDGKVFIEKILTKDEEEEVKGFYKFSRKKYNYDQYEYFYLSKKDELDISKYSILTMVEAYNYNYKNNNYYGEDAEVEFDEIDFQNESNTIVTVDMSDYMEKIIKKCKKGGEYNAQGYFEDNNEIIIDKNSKIIITNLDINYNTSKDIVTNFSCSGMYLEK